MDLPVSLRAGASGMALLVALAPAARANNPPGPQAVAGEVGGMLLILAITTLAGGHAIERARAGRSSRMMPILGVVP